MERFWTSFFSPDDDGGTGDDGGDGTGADDKGGGDDDKGSDVSGLKSALEKERQQRKQLQQQLKELRDVSGKGEEATKELEKLQQKLADFEFRETREAALSKVIEEATKDGKFIVDREKAAKLAGKLRDAATLDADLAEIVDLLKVEKEAGTKQPPIKGQPPRDEGVKGEIPYTEWAALAKSDPEAYKRMIEERRKGRLA